MQNYTNLRVTTRAREVIKATYGFTRRFPREEQFGLTAQMRRAAISGGLNIAEGCSRHGTKELIRFLEVALGSAMEVDFATLVSEDLEMGRVNERDALRESVQILQKELAALVGSLRRRLANHTRS